MLKKIDFKFVVGAISALSLSFFTLTGTIQNFIHFSGVENEMGFALLSMFMSVMFMFGIKK